MAIDHLRLQNRFTYHPPDPTQVPRYETIRNAGLAFARLLVELCPSSPELTIAVNHIDDAVKNANAAIARHDVKEVEFNGNSADSTTDR